MIAGLAIVVVVVVAEVVGTVVARVGVWVEMGTRSVVAPERPSSGEGRGVVVVSGGCSSMSDAACSEVRLGLMVSSGTRRKRRNGPASGTLSAP